MTYVSDDDDDVRVDDGCEDMLRMRAKRPVLKHGNSTSHDYKGRVTRSSKKNVQVEMKFNLDGKIRIVLMHGKQSPTEFACDFGYPYSPAQAFGLSLALQAFKNKLWVIILII